MASELANHMGWQGNVDGAGGTLLAVLETVLQGSRHYRPDLAHCKVCRSASLCRDGWTATGVRSDRLHSASVPDIGAGQLGGIGGLDFRVTMNYIFFSSFSSFNSAEGPVVERTLGTDSKVARIGTVSIVPLGLGLITLKKE